MSLVANIDRWISGEIPEQRRIRYLAVMFGAATGLIYGIAPGFHFNLYNGSRNLFLWVGNSLAGIYSFFTRTPPKICRDEPDHGADVTGIATVRKPPAK